MRVTVARTLTAVRRGLLTLLGLQLAVAIVLSLVDSYRRRGKKPKAFPVSPPETVPVGDGLITTYTFGRDLYDDMLAAIDGATWTAVQQLAALTGSLNAVAAALKNGNGGDGFTVEEAVAAGRAGADAALASLGDKLRTQH